MQGAPLLPYAAEMGRRVALVGSGLAVAGIVVMVVTARSDGGFGGGGTPLQELGAVLLGLLTTLGLLVATVGAVMLALAVTIRYAGHPPVRGYPVALLMTGLGAIVLAEVLRAALSLVLGDSVRSGAMVWVVMGLAHLGGVLQMAGAALLALWLTGRLTAVPSAAGRETRRPGSRTVASADRPR